MASSISDVACWHETDMPTLFRNVRSQGQSRKHVLALSFSGFDPTRTSPSLNGNLFRGQAKTHKIGADDDIPSKARSLGVSTRGTELGATRRKKADGAVRG